MLGYRVRRSFETATGVLPIGTFVDGEVFATFSNGKALLEAGYLEIKDNGAKAEAKAQPAQAGRKRGRK